MMNDEQLNSPIENAYIRGVLSGMLGAAEAMGHKGKQICLITIINKLPDCEISPERVSELHKQINDLI